MLGDECHGNRGQGQGKGKGQGEGDPAELDEGNMSEDSFFSLQVQTTRRKWDSSEMFKCISPGGEMEKQRKKVRHSHTTESKSEEEGSDKHMPCFRIEETKTERYRSYITMVHG